MLVRNTGSEPVEVADVVIDPGRVADVDLTPEEYQRLCIDGPLATMPSELIDAEDGEVRLPPADVAERYGITLPVREE